MRDENLTASAGVSTHAGQAGAIARADADPMHRVLFAKIMQDRLFSMTKLRPFIQILPLCL